jgi:hypothetical protein
LVFVSFFPSCFQQQVLLSCLLIPTRLISAFSTCPIIKVSWPPGLLFPCLLPSAFSSVGPLQSASVVLIATPVLSATKQQGVHFFFQHYSHFFQTPTSIWWPFFSC